VPGDGERPGGIRKRGVLIAPEQHITAGWPNNPGLETPVSVEQRNCPTILRAPCKQSGANHNIPKGDDGAQLKERNPQPRGVLHIYANCIVVEVEVG